MWVVFTRRTLIAAPTGVIVSSVMALNDEPACQFLLGRCELHRLSLRVTDASLGRRDVPDLRFFLAD